ncbi:MAG: nodulation protein NfeD [candidate division Zixibacteria bacterium]|nr:nodulation protein NfeD [candidate division Zixibacteria bacterium]
MHAKHKILLGLLAFLLLSPGISFTLKSVLASDSLTRADSLGPSDSEPAAAGETPLVYTMVIDGAIGTVTNDRINEAIELAEKNDVALLVIFMDTPGGFSKPTSAICKSMLNSRVPVCIYIAPSGARAGSAGVYMAYAAHFAAMAPSTNIGAAHPVDAMGKEIDSVMNEKVTNDAVAQIRAAAERHGRNADWAEKAVRESVSITDSVALALNVIDVRAKDLNELFEKLEGRQTEVPSGTVTMKVKGARTEEIKSSWVYKILELITTPDIAFILFSLGGLGIILELYNPGSILPGVVGAISLILAFYAFQTLPINYAGLALIMLGIILFIAEVKVISHGILTIGGIISMFFGGLMLVDTVDPNLAVSKSILITVVVCVGVVVALAAWLVIKAARHQPYVGREGMIGKTAVVKQDNLVYVNGALWKMESAEDLAVGDKVEIISVAKMVLKVKKLNS